MVLLHGEWVGQLMPMGQVWSCLFLDSSRDKNEFYIFVYLKKKPKEECFMTYENYMKLEFQWP